MVVILSQLVALRSLERDGEAFRARRHGGEPERGPQPSKATAETSGRFWVQKHGIQCLLRKLLGPDRVWVPPTCHVGRKARATFERVNARTYTCHGTLKRFSSARIGTQQAPPRAQEDWVLYMPRALLYSVGRGRTGCSQGRPYPKKPRMTASANAPTAMLR